MTTSRLIRAPLWATLLIALVAAMVSYFVFVPSSEGAPAADQKTYEPYIINGAPVPNGKYPFMSFLEITFTDGSDADNKPDGIFCGGSLIDADSVLTAAHCVTPETPGQRLLDVKVTVGMTVQNSNQGQHRSDKSVFIHPNNNGFAYDAAVVELSRPVSGIEPIKLASSKQDNLEKPGRTATVAGWGSTTARPACKNPNTEPMFPDRMREAQLPIVSDSKADQLYENICQSSGVRSLYIPRLMVAAGGTGKDTCQGDSGGPLFVRTSGNGDGDNGDNGDDKNGGSSAKYTQIGITSFGPGCGPERYPGAYAEVNAKPIASFIERAADNGNGDGDGDGDGDN